jgi:hypothetical protein
MKNTSRIRSFFFGISVLILLALLTSVYHLGWGKLFPYSPVSFGFTEVELPRIILVVQHGADTTGLTAMQAVLTDVEAFHELRFIAKPRLYVFRDSMSYLRRSMTRARFIAYPNESLLISPWAMKESEEGTISLAVYLRHELSHTLLYQYMNLRTAYMKCPRWFLEGIAMYSVQQMGTSLYPSKAETYRYISNGNFMPPEDYNTSNEDRVKLDVHNRIGFIYSEFGVYVEYLVSRYGKERFIRYMKAVIGGADHDGVFNDVFGIGFQESLRQFRDHCRGAID